MYKVLSKCAFMNRRLEMCIPGDCSECAMPLGIQCALGKCCIHSEKTQDMEVCIQIEFAQ